VLGIIEDERPGGMIPMAQLKHDIGPERQCSEDVHFDLFLGRPVDSEG
jgi:hypothetical protein